MADNNEVDEILKAIIGDSPTRPIRLEQKWQAEYIGKTSIPCDLVVLPMENQVAVVERKRNRVVIYGDEGKELHVLDNEEISDLKEPTALAMMEHRLLLADAKMIHFINVSQWLEDRVWQPKGRAASDFSAIYGMCVSSANNEVILTDVSRNPTVTAWDLDYERQKHSLKAPKDRPFRKPNHVAASPDGFTYVSDCEAHCVYVFDKKGKFVNYLGSKNNAEGQLIYPVGVDVTNKGEVLVCDPPTGKVALYNSKGEYRYPLLDHLDGVHQPVAARFYNGKIAVTEEILEHHKDKNYVRLFEIVTKKGKK